MVHMCNYGEIACLFFVGLISVSKTIYVIIPISALQLC